MLQIDTPYLTLGTVSAVFLTAIGSYIIALTTGRRAPLDDVKLLSIMALNNSAVAARLDACNMETPMARRVAGEEFKIHIEDRRLIAEDMNYQLVDK